MQPETAAVRKQRRNQAAVDKASRVDVVVQCGSERYVVVKNLECWYDDRFEPEVYDALGNCVFEALEKIAVRHQADLRAQRDPLPLFEGMGSNGNS